MLTEEGLDSEYQVEVRGAGKHATHQLGTEVFMCCVMRCVCRLSS